ncbi:MAG: hypothetical protein R3F50_00270 [Gammaproteobacteria bacterium]
MSGTQPLAWMTGMAAAAGLKTLSGLTGSGADWWFSARLKGAPAAAGRPCPAGHKLAAGIENA